MGEADVIFGIKIKRENKGIVITQSHYIEKILTENSIVMKIVLECRVLFTRPDIAYAVGRLSRFTSNPSRQHWKAVTRVFKFIFYEWMGVPAWGDGAFQGLQEAKLPPGSTLESEFVSHFACVSAPTMAKAYSQIYNGKSRHLGVRHSMIRELIMNGVISIEFVRSQKNLADHLTKGLARDLLEIGTQVSSSRGARSKGTTYVNMKFRCLFFSRFKK
ncbi:hypothetical protein Tco_1234485 [Tanacetum coccineum]